MSSDMYSKVIKQNVANHSKIYKTGLYSQNQPNKAEKNAE